MYIHGVGQQCDVARCEKDDRREYVTYGDVSGIMYVCMQYRGFVVWYHMIVRTVVYQYVPTLISLHSRLE